MNPLLSHCARWLACLLLCTWLPAQAHLMVAQKGTLNLVGDGAFMVISVPVSAFKGVDDDGDGKWSMNEMRAHQPRIEQQAQQHLQLRDASQRAQPLQGFMLTLSPAHDGPNATADQVVLMGRFALANPAARHRLHVGLYGAGAAEQSFHITLTRGSDKQVAVFSPEHPSHTLFPSAWTVFADFASLGAEHILLGYDHLLFLLTVLMVGVGWRYFGWVTLSFTVAHSLALTAAVLGWVQLAGSIVEPLIAASIVLLALDNLYNSWRGRQVPLRHRAVVVFACGLLHGLGFASVLTQLGLQGQQLAPSLAGFNLGVELGQLAFLLMLVAVSWSVRKLAPQVPTRQLVRGASALAALAGFGMLMGRVVGG